MPCNLPNNQTSLYLKANIHEQGNCSQFRRVQISGDYVKEMQQAVERWVQKKKNFHVTWKDEDSESILLGSKAAEWEECLRYFTQGSDRVVRIDITIQGKKSKPVSAVGKRVQKQKAVVDRPCPTLSPSEIQIFLSDASKQPTTGTTTSMTTYQYPGASPVSFTDLDALCDGCSSLAVSDLHVSMRNNGLSSSSGTITNGCCNPDLQQVCFTDLNALINKEINCGNSLGPLAVSDLHISMRNDTAGGKPKCHADSKLSLSKSEIYTSMAHDELTSSIDVVTAVDVGTQKDAVKVKKRQKKVSKLLQSAQRALPFDSGRAIARCAKAVGEDPDNSFAWLLLSLSHAYDGDLAASTRAFKKAESLQ
eukprot:TRINITY_DN12787_c2_g1_i1.p1 TRINITY_DN12787_c2_g1~~TRINITY_DN12787_c2_g1_i1.p1  ORF type:complete len:386 (+),score=68.73 TRINITY_DN12787_c2_g1_i1:67-1158(+)